MKNLILSLGFLFSLAHANAQTSIGKLTVSAGFGFQQYSGDLGNGFYDFSSTEYGVASIGLDYYLTRSFDVKLFGTLGDLGYCSDLEEGEGGVVEDVLNSRMTMGSLSLKYKFANGFLLPQDAKLAPYIYAGFGINKVTDIMEMGCIIPGTYTSINAGVGFKYNISPLFNIGYNLNIGQFSTDKIDFISAGRNDFYMQNSLVLGVNIFKK
jgi:OmpA-OmpF porin, OOP family